MINGGKMKNIFAALLKVLHFVKTNGLSIEQIRPQQIYILSKTKVKIVPLVNSKDSLEKELKEKNRKIGGDMMGEI